MSTTVCSHHGRRQSLMDELPCAKQDPGSTFQGAFAANALLILSTIIRCGATLGMLRVLNVSLGEEQLAIWITVSTVAMYISLCEAGLGQTVINRIGEAYARGDLQLASQIQATAHGLYWILVGTTAVASLLMIRLFPVASWLLSAKDASYADLLTTNLSWAIVLGLARLPFLVFPATLVATRQMPLRLLCEIGATIVAMAAGMAAALSGMGLLGVVAATNIAHLLTTMAVYLFSSRIGAWAKLRLSYFRFSHLRPLAHMSFYFFLINMAFLLDRTILNLIVGKLGALSLVPPLFLLMTFYRVAAWTCVSALSKAVQPYVILWSAQERSDSVLFVTSICTKLTMLFALLLMAAFMPFAEPFVNWWLGSINYPGTATVLLMTATFLIDALFITTINIMMVVKSHRSLAVVLMAKAMLSIGIGWFLVQFTTDTVFGASLGVLMSTVAMSGFMPFIARRALSITAKKYMTSILQRPLWFGAAIFTAVTAVTFVQDPAMRAVGVLVVVSVSIILTWFILLVQSERQLCLKGCMHLMAWPRGVVKNTM